MVLIVFLQQEVDVFVNEPFHFPHGVRRHAPISGQGHGIKPKLALSVGTPNVNMGRLSTLISLDEMRNRVEFLPL
jgi:hypothetical protein